MQLLSAAVFAKVVSGSIMTKQRFSEAFKKRKLKKTLKCLIAYYAFDKAYIVGELL